MFQLKNQCKLNAKESEEVFGKLQETELQLQESYAEIANLKVELSFNKSATYPGRKDNPIIIFSQCKWKQAGKGSNLVSP